MVFPVDYERTRALWQMGIKGRFLQAVFEISVDKPIF
jgi:hypothetical protein